MVLISCFQDVIWQCFGTDPKGPAEGRRSGLGPTGRSVPEPGLPGFEGGLSAEQNPVPGPHVPCRTILIGLQRTRTFVSQNQGGKVEETDGKEQTRPVKSASV